MTFRGPRAIARLLPDRALIEMRSSSTDAEGGTSDTWSTRVSSVRCQLAPAGDVTEIRNASGEFVRVDAVCYLQGNVAVIESDRITVHGDTFEVIGVQHDSYDVVTVVSVQRRS